MKEDSGPPILGHGTSVPLPKPCLLGPSVNGQPKKSEACLLTITCVDHDAFTQFIRQEAAADRLSLLDRR